MPGDSPPEPGPLGVSSIVMPPGAPYRAWISSSTSSRAPGSRPPIGIRPFLPVLLAGALASRGRRARLRRHGLRVPRGVAVPARACSSWSSCSTSSRRRAGRDAADRPPLLYVLLGIALVLGALLAAGSVADHSSDWWAGAIVGVACAALGFQAARSLFGRVRRRLDARGGERAAGLRRGRRARRRRAVDPLPAARDPRHRRPRLAARRRPPPRGREVRRPAHPALSAVAAARSSSSPSSTR